MSSRSQERTILDVGTWEQTFQELIQQARPRDRWTLQFSETVQPDCVALGWKQYRQTAFGRFRCSSCRRNWASAKVQILCHLYLESWRSQGQVQMRLFCQRCRRCSQSPFEKPEFSEESAMRILNNLVQRILEKYYGNGSRKFSEIPVRPEVPLEGSHDMANCEACALGICVQNLQISTANPSTSPLSYMEIGNSLPLIGDVSGQNQARNQSAQANETQGSGRYWGNQRSGPSYSTAGNQVPGTGQNPTAGADRQAAGGTRPQIIQVAGSLPPGWTDLQSTRRAGPTATYMPPNASFGQDNLVMWGCVCVAALWAFFTSRYF